MSTQTIPEEWRPIPGYEGHYSVSSAGRIRNDRWQKILSPFIEKGGYAAVHLYGRRPRRKVMVHQTVALVFIGAPTGPLVRHLNGDSRDNRAINLAYGTTSQNALDAVAHGTHPQSRKTHCPQGHAYTGRNVLVESGIRRCRTCVAARKAATYRERVSA